MRVLALDLGSKRIGVAVSDASGTLASPVCVIERVASDEGARSAISALVQDLEVQHVLVGLPLSLSGAEGPAATKSRKEIGELAGCLDVPVEAIDERFSTVAAHKLLEAGGHDSRARRTKVDAAAAAILLQGWLDARGARSKMDGAALERTDSGDQSMGEQG